MCHPVRRNVHFHAGTSVEVAGVKQHLCLSATLNSREHPFKVRIIGIYRLRIVSNRNPCNDASEIGQGPESVATQGRVPRGHEIVYIGR